jgi:hypothetical protein
VLDLRIRHNVELAETARGVEKVGEVCEGLLETVSALSFFIQSTWAACERKQKAWRQERAELEWRDCEREAQHNEVRAGLAKCLECLGEDVEEMLRLTLEVEDGLRAEAEEQAMLVKHLRCTLAELQAGKHEAELKVQAQRRKAAQVIEQLRQDLIQAQELHALELQEHEAPSPGPSPSPSDKRIQGKATPVPRGRVGSNGVVEEEHSSSSSFSSSSPTRRKLPGQVWARGSAVNAVDDKNSVSNDSSSISPRRRGGRGTTGAGREGNRRGPGRGEDGEREVLLEALRKSRLLLAENERLLESACPKALPLLQPLIAVPLSIACGPMWLDAVSRCVDTLMQAFALLLVI